jgi:hypothetical protein
MKPKLLLLACAICCAGFTLQCSAQHVRAFNNNVTDFLNAQGSSHGLFKATLIVGIEKGTSIGASYGLWKENSVLQYSLNTGFMWRFGHRFLGNYRTPTSTNDPRTRSQFVFMFSPMLTGHTKDEFVYQELEPFYLGTPNAVFCKFKYSLTFGTTFTISPRGTYNNVATIRNRAQQVFVGAVNIGKFNFTIYDDYFPFFTKKAQLGDNWDRYFTGGGFIRYRFNDQFTFHLYSEVYTGINRADQFLYPDIISYKQHGRKWFRKNYANQDPGQEFFNTSWFIGQLTYTSPQVISNSAGLYVPDMNVFIGTSAPWTMFSQEWIHSLISHDTLNCLQHHFFLPRSKVPGNLEAGGGNKFSTVMNSFFIGGGASYNIY